MFMKAIKINIRNEINGICKKINEDKEGWYRLHIG